MSGTENTVPATGLESACCSEADRRSRYFAQQARNHVLAGQLELAYPCYREALAYRPCPELRSELGDVLAQGGRTELALECYDPIQNRAAREFLSDERFAQTNQLTRLACIYYYGRSGSIFLQSLLDDHPQLITVAGAYLQDYYQFWSLHGALPQPELLERFCAVFSPMFAADRPSYSYANDVTVFSGEVLGLTRMGPDRDEILKVDEARFRVTLQSLTGSFRVLTSRYFFQAIHAAYCLCLGCDLKSKEMMILQCHFAPIRNRLARKARAKSQRLLVDFPASHHIFTLRSPLATLESYLTHLFRPEHLRYYRAANIAGYVLPEILLGGEPITPGLQGASIGVRLEDLHRDGAAIMRALSSWLKITWDERLLVSSFHGVQWWNVPHSPAVSGFNQAVLAKKKDSHFSAFDAFRLKALLAPKFSTWEYSLTRGLANPVLRALVVPLLIFPFRMETASWKAFRLEANWLSRVLSFCKGYLIFRLVAVQFWIESWTLSRREVRLLRPLADQAP